MSTINIGKVKITPKGDYNNATQYEVLDVVTYNGSGYIAKSSTVGNVPTDTNFWQLLASKGATGASGTGGTGSSSAWSDITEKPTTVDEFGIEDAVKTNDARLSDARPSSDVSAWAKQPTRPVYTKSDIGLGSVDNTADTNKPISTLQQTALNLKEDKSNKGLPNGYVGLDENAKINSSYLPSYVDDVLEFVNLVSFPITGEAGKIYTALDTNKTYRWGGSSYTAIASGSVDSVNGKTGVVSLIKSDIGLGNVDNTADNAKDVARVGGKQASDFATSAQGTKADSAVQGVKVNGTTYNPDPTTKVVDLGIISSGNGITTEQSTKLDSALQGIKINGNQLTPNSSRIIDLGLINTSVNESQFFTESSDPYLSNRVLVWEDDFTGIELNPNNWQKSIRPDNANVLQAYTERPENVRVENSNLIITALKENYSGLNAYGVMSDMTWTSGRINSQSLQEFQYGRIEAKMKFDKLQGMWAAFWTLGANFGIGGTAFNSIEAGEIDIMEHISVENYIHSVVHYADASGNLVSFTDSLSATLDYSQYHIYAIEWTSTQIIFLVDGVQTVSFNVSNADISGSNPFRKPQFLILNMAVGGSWAGNPDVETTKSEMLVDWVRVYAPEGEVGIIEPEIVSLNQTSVTVVVGTKTILVPIFTPSNVIDKTLKWVSSNPSIAKVISGGVTGVSQGSCTVYAITNNGKSASCQVTVN
jgi:beta-glucanase (GH16 family)